jgi:hypothetical protein
MFVTIPIHNGVLVSECGCKNHVDGKRNIKEAQVLDEVGCATRWRFLKTEHAGNFVGKENAR